MSNKTIRGGRSLASLVSAFAFFTSLLFFYPSSTESKVSGLPSSVDDVEARANVHHRLCEGGEVLVHYRHSEKRKYVSEKNGNC